MRSQNTYEALCALGEDSVVQRGFEAIELGQLADDYMMLRRVELRLKLGAQSRDAVVPGEESARTELARSLGLYGEDALQQLEHLLQGVRGRVQAVTDAVFPALKDR